MKKLWRYKKTKKAIAGFLIFFFITSFLQPLFAPQKAQANPGTRTKTVEFFVGQNVSTTGIASGTQATYNFQVNLPDAVTNPVKSAYILYHTVVSATNGTAASFQLGPQGGTLQTLSAPAAIYQSGESQPIIYRLDATSVLQSTITTAGTYNLTFTTSITGPTRYGELAKLILTYDFNDASSTQLKTIKYFIGQDTSTRAAGASVQFTLGSLGLPEFSVTTRSAFAEVHAYTYQASNASYTVSFQWDSETAKQIAWSGTTNSYDIYALITPSTTYSPTSSHTFTVTNNSGGTLSAINAHLVFTFEFSYNNSTQLSQSLAILLYQGTETASTATLTGNLTVNFPENSVSLLNSFLLGRAVQTNTAARTLGMNAQLNSAPTSSTAINFNANAGETSGFTTILANTTSGLSGLTSGNNTIYWRYDSSAAANIRGLTINILYKFNKSNSTVLNSQIEWWVDQETAASTTRSKDFTPSVSDATYNLQFSYLNVSFNENTTSAVTMTVGISTTASYAFLSTGEAVLGQVWHNTSSDVTALNTSYTATFNSSASATKSACFLAIFQTSLNNPPNPPSNLGPSQYVDDGWTNDNTPTFNFTLSDPDPGQQVKFRIQIDDNADFSSPVVDYTSALGSQGSFSFTVGQAAGGGSYTVGSQGQVLADSPSSGGYYWRVLCIDAVGAQSNWTIAGSSLVIDFKVDTTAPNQGNVFNSSSSYPANQVWFAQWGNTLYGNWPNWTDSNSGIASYDYSIGSLPGQTNILSWQNTTASNGTYSYSGNRNEVFSAQSSSLTINTIYAIAWNPSDKIWLIGGSSGAGPKLYKYDGLNFVDLTSYLAGSWGTNYIKAIAFNGSYWLCGGTEGMLNRINANPQAASDFTDLSSNLNFGSNAVNTIFWNASNSIWLIGGGTPGTGPKLSKYNGSSFSDLSSYLNNWGTNTIYTLFFNGSYWLCGGSGGKLNKINANPQTASDFTDLSASLAGWSGQDIYALGWSGEENYWLVGGASNGTTARLNRVNSTATVFTDASTWLKNFGNNHIYSLYCNGSYWLLGGSGGKVNWANRIAGSTYDFSDKSTEAGFGSYSVYAICYAPYQYSGSDVLNWDYWFLGGAGNSLMRYGVTTYYFGVKAYDNVGNQTQPKWSAGQRIYMIGFNGFIPQSIVPNLSGTGSANTYIDYNLTLYNYQSVADTISLSATSSRSWTVSVISSNPVNVPAGGSVTVTIRVNIPSQAQDNEIDVTTIQATSGNNNNVKALATCITTVVNANINLSILRVYDRNGDYSDNNMDFGNVSPDLSPFIIGESLTHPYGGIRLKVEATGGNFNLTVRSLSANFTSQNNKTIPVNQLQHAIHSLSHQETDWISFSTTDYILVSNQPPGTYSYDFDYRLNIYWDNDVDTGYNATIQYTATLN
jgi:hypothetical protein